MREDDIRRFRFKIKTPSGDEHVFSGKRTYEYLCAAAEANGEYIDQARESAINTMRVALQTGCNLLTDCSPDHAYLVRSVTP